MSEVVLTRQRINVSVPTEAEPNAVINFTAGFEETYGTDVANQQDETVACPAGQVAVGLNANVGFWSGQFNAMTNPNPRYLASLGIECRTLNLDKISP